MPQGDWFDGAGNGSEVDVGEFFDGMCVQGMRELVDAGALVSMGKTSEGGALGFTVTVDGRWRREYFRNADELTLWIGEALPAVQHARNGRGPSSGSRSRSRKAA